MYILGAGETMLEAVLVNPLESNMLADAIKHAFDMDYHERKLRMNALQNRERLFNLDTWLESCFESVDQIDNNNSLNKMRNLTINDIESWLSPIIKGYKVTIILDYDGTLVPLKPHPSLAKMSDDVKDYLEQLISFPEIDVCILSGRSLDDLKKMIQIKNINLAGSHGLEIHLANSQHEHVCEQAIAFKAKIPDLVQDLKDNVCAQGGWIEEKVILHIFKCKFGFILINLFRFIMLLFTGEKLSPIIDKL